MRSDKRDFPPHGLDGGRPGNGPTSLVISGDDEVSLPVLVTEAVILKRNDVFCHITPSGGGRGDPLLRDPAAVLEDVLEQKVTPGFARDAYGVVFRSDGNTRSIDVEATAALREHLMAAPLQTR